MNQYSLQGVQQKTLQTLQTLQSHILLFQFLPLQGKACKYSPKKIVILQGLQYARFARFSRAKKLTPVLLIIPVVPLQGLQVTCKLFKPTFYPLKGRASIVKRLWMSFR